LLPIEEVKPPPRDVEPMEEEDVVFNRVIVILYSINWLIFVIIQGGKEGEEGCPSGHLLTKNYACLIWRSASRTTHFRLLQMFESWCLCTVINVR
jgi:hypothetical protein